MQPERYPLPFGWIKQLDEATGREFYVDTKAAPPRSIWVHPYEDAEYLKAHPDVREKLHIDHRPSSESDLPPPSFEESQRRHSDSGGKPSTSMPVAGSSKPRGAIGALKDQLFGTKEERKAHKLKKQEEERARREAQRQYMEQRELARQQYYASQPQCGYGSSSRFGGGPYGGGFGSQQRGRGGGGNLALPILGGLAGGLLLGEVFDDFGDGGFGGGFDGGGFDGGF